MNRRIAAASMVVVAVGAVAVFWPDPTIPLDTPETVHLAAARQDYRPAGEFRQGTRIMDAPALPLDASALDIMKHHVTEADYALCVTEGACPALPSAGRA